MHGEIDNHDMDNNGNDFIDVNDNVENDNYEIIDTGSEKH